MKDIDNLIKTLKNANDKLLYDEKRVIKLVKLLADNGQNKEAKTILDKANFEHPSNKIKQLLAEI